MTQRLVVAVHSTDPLTVPGLVSLLRDRPEMQVVPLQRVAEARVAVIATDLVTAEVIATLEHVAAHSEARIILLANELTDADVRTAVRCGVVSVLPRASLTGEKLIRAVVAADQLAARPSAELMERLMGQLDRVQRGLLRPQGVGQAALAPRERDLLRLLAEGCDTAEIASRLAYSERTVKNIVQGLLARLELKNRTHAVAYAMRAGVL